MAMVVSFENPVFLDLLKSYSPEFIINTLRSFLSEERLSKFNDVLRNRLSSIHVAFESPCNVHNALASLRSAEGVGINHMHIIAPEDGERSRQGRRTTKGSYRWSHLKYYESLPNFTNRMKEHNFKIYGASLETSKTLADIDVTKPVCLIFGNELRGLSEDALKVCDGLYKIPMQGMVESFNLTVSCAISLYELSKRKRLSLENMGDLSDNQIEREKAWYIVRSIGVDKSKQYLRCFKNLASKK